MACCDTKVLEQALEPSGSRLFHVFNDTLILLSLYVCGLGLFFFNDSFHFFFGHLMHESSQIVMYSCQVSCWVVNIF